MICPKCNFANPEGMQFCGKCGTRVERICLKCHSPNPPDSYSAANAALTPRPLQKTVDIPSEK